MSKKKTNQTQIASMEMKPTETKNKPFLLIFVCVFLSVVLLSGAILGTVFAIRAANSAVEYGGVRMSRTVANYFASYAKAYYLGNELADIEEAADTPEFWNSYERGTDTYGDGMEKYVREYLCMVVAGCYLYDSITKLDANAKSAIRKNVESRLLYIADGNRKEFNSLVKQFGFDYDDFYKATEMMYKTLMVPYLLYGAGGSGLKNDVELSNEYYELSYRRVRLLFIRTESDYVLTDSGNRLTDDEGKDRLVYLTPTEIAEREADIASIDEAIENFKNDSDGQMSEISFELYLEKYKATNLNLNPNGEYYASKSEYANLAYEEFPEVVSTAILMQKGTYEKVEIEEVGVCYIYSMELEPGAYTDTDEDGPFSDFYSDLADYKYQKVVMDLIDEVTVNDRFYEIDLIALPKNGIYTIGL